MMRKSQIKVGIIEPDSDVLHLLLAHLQRDGRFAISIFPTAKTALESMTVQAQDVFLVASQLGDCNAIEFLERARDMGVHKNSKIALMSSRGGQNGQFDLQIEKPLDLKKLTLQILALFAPLSKDPLAKIKAEYAKSLPDRAKALEMDLGQYFNEPEQRNAAQLLHNAHRLRGSGTSYGFPEISKTAATLEDALVNNAVPLEILLNGQALVTALYQAGNDYYTIAEQMVAESAPHKHILVVDDDPDVAALIEACAPSDANVTAVSNVSDALKQLENQNWDMAFFDQNLEEGGRGASLLCAVRKKPKWENLPIIMLTAETTAAFIVSQFANGATDYLLKPVDQHALQDKINSILSAAEKTVLLVDDDLAIQDLLEARFREKGYHTLRASEGSAAWQSIQQSRPDLVLLDQMMPNISGETLLSWIREDPNLRDIPVIYLTARNQQAERMAGLESGANDYIAKPFDIDEVLLRAARLLEPRNASIMAS